MPKLTGRRAGLVAGVVACVIYANAVMNGWAIDDTKVVQENPAAHSIGAALDHAFASYWPPLREGRGGLYRPLVVLSYGIDWTLSGGNPWGFHVTNLLLHGLATGLLVLVVLAWLPPAGALAAGLVFAVHPVHVEAVANVVGRAEIMAACGILLTVLAARRYRRAAGAAAPWWFAGAMAATVVALASKEAGVVTIGVLLVDRWLDPEGEGRRDSLGLYLAVLGLTMGWLFLWREIAGAYATETVAAGIRWLRAGERWATVVPAQLHLVRLLVWPINLSMDYSPLVIPRRTEWGPIATVAAVTSTAILVLAFAVARRAPAVTFALLVAAGSFLPTSNLLFPAGIVLAERVLYLAAIAPACVVGWVVSRHGPQRQRRLALVAIGLLLIVFAVRTVFRTPIWRNTVTAVTQEALEHPQNYRAHIWLGDLFVRTGDSTRAVSEFMTANELFADPFTTRLLIPLALARGAHRIAVEEARLAYGLVPGHPEVGGFLMRSYLASGQPDSAFVVIRQVLEISPGSKSASDDYVELLARREAPEWQRLLAVARRDWLGFRFSATGQELDSAAALAPAAEDLDDFCWELEATRPMIADLRPALGEGFTRLAAARDLGCRFDPVP